MLPFISVIWFPERTLFLSDTEFSLQEHKNCGEMTEIEAKVKYVKLARSLRTYGVSFFLVKVGFLLALADHIMCLVMYYLSFSTKQRSKVVSKPSFCKQRLG